MRSRANSRRRRARERGRQQLVRTARADRDVNVPTVDDDPDNLQGLRDADGEPGNVSE